MPIYGRHFESGQLQFITTSTYRRSRLLTCQRFCWTFVETQLRQETKFLLIDWVLMPEHFNLLITPQPTEQIVRFMKELKKHRLSPLLPGINTSPPAALCSPGCNCPPPSTAIRTIDCGRGAMSRLTFSRRKNA